MSKQIKTGTEIVAAFETKPAPVPDTSNGWKCGMQEVHVVPLSEEDAGDIEVRIIKRHKKEE